MKNIFLIASIMLSLAASTFSQTDSVMFIKEVDFSIYKTHVVTFQSTREKKQVTESTDLENVSVLTFLQNDSLELTSETGDPFCTRLADVREVSKYKSRFSPVLGITLGAIGGGLLGVVVGWAVSGSESKSGNLFNPLVSGISDAVSRTTGTIVGALIGAVGGGVLGAIITNAINHSSLDLFSVREDGKKSELIKFLRQK